MSSQDSSTAEASPATVRVESSSSPVTSSDVNGASSSASPMSDDAIQLSESADLPAVSATSSTTSSVSGQKRRGRPPRDPNAPRPVSDRKKKEDFVPEVVPDAHGDSSVRQSTRKRKIRSFDASGLGLSEAEKAHMKLALENSLRSAKADKTDLREVPRAPTFYPTAEEWKMGPAEYIKKIQPEASRYGICRIVPPATWDPPMCLRRNAPFPTKLQQIDRLQEGRNFEKGRDFPCYTEYAEIAQKFKGQWIQLRNGGETPSLDDLEDEYWSIVSRRAFQISAEYGNDLSQKVCGSGFQTLHKVEKVEDKEVMYDEKGQIIDESKYGGHIGWNLNFLPYIKESLLKNMKNPVEGVMIPWVYIGMIFASFCWHVEDDYLYSLNYMHEGDSKVWYGVPGSAAKDFETVLKKECAGLFEKERDLLDKLTTMLNPTLLQACDIPVYKIEQKPKEFIITFPQAYHAGFSTGVTVAEAVNICLSSWLPYGRQAIGRYKANGRGSCVCYPQLLMEAVLNEPHKHDPLLLYNEMVEMAQLETKGRAKLNESGIRQYIELSILSDTLNLYNSLFHSPSSSASSSSSSSSSSPSSDLTIADLDPFKHLEAMDVECAHCRGPTFLSFLACSCLTRHTRPRVPTLEKALVSLHSDIPRDGTETKANGETEVKEPEKCGTDSPVTETYYHNSLSCHHQVMSNASTKAFNSTLNLFCQAAPLSEQVSTGTTSIPAEVCTCSCGHRRYCLSEAKYLATELAHRAPKERPVLYTRFEPEELKSLAIAVLGREMEKHKTNLNVRKRGRKSAHEVDLEQALTVAALAAEDDSLKAERSRQLHWAYQFCRAKMEAERTLGNSSSIAFLNKYLLGSLKPDGVDQLDAVSNTKSAQKSKNALKRSKALYQDIEISSLSPFFSSPMGSKLLHILNQAGANARCLQAATSQEVDQGIKTLLQDLLISLHAESTHVEGFTSKIETEPTPKSEETTS